ncbi:MAG: hypothetical protein E6Q97_33995 [Desulfurellales bacterium]|nr:MAG: hypothetical protein E6Q97_33995 [Desulfurellales bacterium]
MSQDPNEPKYTPPPVTGYRTLSQNEVDLMNAVKALGPGMQTALRMVEQYIADQNEQHGIGDAEALRWTRIAQDHFQQGLMCLARAVARPEGF